MKPFLLALLCGILFALALPPWNWEWAGWVGLAPLMVAAIGLRPLEALGLGLIAGGICGVLHTGWNRDTERLFWAYLPFLWLMLLFGMVAVAASLAWLRMTGLSWAVWVACVAVSGEWLTTGLPLPINVALCAYKTLPVIQIASLTGIWGVSLLLWFVNAAIADAILLRTARTRSLGVAAGLLLLTLGFGTIRLRYEPPAPVLRVAAIQDFTGDETGDLAPMPDPNAPEPDRETMTRQASTAGAKLVVWSEECLGSAFRPDDPQDGTRTLARRLQIGLVVGYSDNSRPKPFNCSALIGPHGNVLGIHHKIHLYLGENQSVQAGGPPRAYATPRGRMGLEVCFDSCYVDVTRQIAADGARLIAMPNYDPPTPRGVLHELHGAMLPFRAVENDVAFVRSDSNGLSQIVAPDGRIVAQGPLYAPAIVVAAVPLGSGHGTLFTRWGNWLAYLCLTWAIFYGIAFSRGISFSHFFARRSFRVE